MLLRYIHHARNADQHTIEETIQHIAGSWKLKNIQNKNFTKSLKIENGVITEYQGSPRELEISPSRIVLLRFKENGHWHNTPTQHLDINLEHRDPVSIAEVGLEFYKQFLKVAEEKFA